MAQQQIIKVLRERRDLQRETALQLRGPPRADGGKTSAQMRQRAQAQIDLKPRAREKRQPDRGERLDDIVAERVAHRIDFDRIQAHRNAKSLRALLGSQNDRAIADIELGAVSPMDLIVVAVGSPVSVRRQRLIP